MERETRLIRQPKSVAMHRPCTQGWLNSICMMRRDLHAPMLWPGSPLTFLTENPGVFRLQEEQQTVLHHCKCSSLVIFLPRVAFLLPGLTVLTRSGLKNTSLLVITAARMECGSVGRQWGEKQQDVLIQRVSRRRGGNRSPTVNVLIFILFC